MEQDYDNDGNNIVPCPICLDNYCPSKQDKKCPEENAFIKDMNTQELKQQAREEFIDFVDEEIGIVDGACYPNEDRDIRCKSFIDSLIDRTVQMEREKIVGEIENFDYEMYNGTEYQRGQDGYGVYYVDEVTFNKLQEDIINTLKEGKE